MIGQMRDKITFQSPVAVNVGAGGTDVSYTDTLTDWAKATPVSSQTEVDAFRTSLGKVYRFVIRYRAGFTPVNTMLISYDSRLFSISGIEEVNERQRFWRITAIEKS